MGQMGRIRQIRQKGRIGSIFGSGSMAQTDKATEIRATGAAAIDTLII